MWPAIGNVGHALMSCAMSCHVQSCYDSHVTPPDDVDHVVPLVVRVGGPLLLLEDEGGVHVVQCYLRTAAPNHIVNCDDCNVVLN